MNVERLDRFLPSIKDQYTLFERFAQSGLVRSGPVDDAESRMHIAVHFARAIDAERPVRFLSSTRDSCTSLDQPPATKPKSRYLFGTPNVTNYQQGAFRPDEIYFNTRNRCVFIISRTPPRSRPSQERYMRYVMRSLLQDLSLSRD